MTPLHLFISGTVLLMLAYALGVWNAKHEKAKRKRSLLDRCYRIERSARF